MENIVSCFDYSYFDYVNIIRQLCEKYKCLSKNVIGRSCAGRDINALRIGASKDYALIVGGIHGSERIACTIILMFIEKLCAELQSGGIISGLNVSRALFNRGVIFVPCVNPDGCEIAHNGIKGCGALGNIISRLCDGNFKHWNSNLRGVDINHNFSAGWRQLHELEKQNGITGPAPTRFGGYSPESEPETLALTELCRTTKIRHVVALHTQGEVIYWKYGNDLPPKSKKMAQIMATTSQYELDDPEGIAIGGGFKDWFITEFNRPGFTVELGKGTNPLPITDAIDIYNKVEEMLMLCCIM